MGWFRTLFGLVRVARYQQQLMFLLGGEDRLVYVCDPVIPPPASVAQGSLMPHTALSTEPHAATYVLGTTSSRYPLFSVGYAAG